MNINSFKKIRVYKQVAYRRCRSCRSIYREGRSYGAVYETMAWGRCACDGDASATDPVNINDINENIRRLL